MPAVFFFLVDVSMNAIRTGATAAACSAISQAIADLPVNKEIFSPLMHIASLCLPSNNWSFVAMH